MKKFLLIYSIHLHFYLILIAGLILTYKQLPFPIIFAQEQSSSGAVLQASTDQAFDYESKSNVLKTVIGVAPVVLGSGKISCPLKGTRIIGCGSWRSDAKYNRGVCRGSVPDDNGHCGRVYGLSCSFWPLEQKSRSRWPQSIDIDADAGETVFAPAIDGASVEWKFTGRSYDVPPDAGGGWGHGFETTVGTDKWMIFTVHMNRYPLSPPNGSTYKTGDPLVTVANTPYTHLHFNAGKNVVDQDGGPGWIAPESLGTCTNE